MYLKSDETHRGVCGPRSSHSSLPSKSAFMSLTQSNYMSNVMWIGTMTIALATHSNEFPCLHHASQFSRLSKSIFRHGYQEHYERKGSDNRHHGYQKSDGSIPLRERVHCYCFLVRELGRDIVVVDIDLWRDENQIEHQCSEYDPNKNNKTKQDRIISDHYTLHLGEETRSRHHQHSNIYRI